MKKTLLMVAATGVILAVGVGLTLRHHRDTTHYRLVPITRGDVVATVTATGTLSPVTTVQVGTQVSGQIAQLYADFNDHVRRGQLLALLDTTLLAEEVTQARAQLLSAQADLAQKQYLLAQADTLHRRGLMAETDYRTALFNEQSSEASDMSAQANLQRAEQNLAYTVIRSPIDGIVIERDVNVGQTVASSLQAPQLFLIAQDLSNMQILASVDESDIGNVKDGQNATFTVEAYPNRRFNGTVRQVRLQNTTTQNVVNYTVVVGVQNQDGALKPGMTATVDFETARADSVLTIANAALRFKAPQELIAEAIAAGTLDTTRHRRPGADSAGGQAAGAGAFQAPGGTRGGQGAGGAQAFGGGPGGFGGGPGGFGGGQAGGRSFSSTRGGFARLWYLNDQGEPAVTGVRIGITDGQKTEIEGRNIKEGMQVIAGILAAGENAAATSTNPFQSQQQGFRRPGGF